MKNLQNATLVMHMLNSNQNLIYYNPNLWYDVYFSFEKEWNFKSAMWYVRKYTHHIVNYKCTFNPSYKCIYEFIFFPFLY